MSDHFTSSDEDLEEILDLLEVPKSLNYFEEVVPQLTNAQYSAHFRVSRHMSQHLAERFGAFAYYHHQEGDSIKVTPLKYILVFLWFSANESVSYRDVADRFAISHSTLFKIVRRVTNFLSNLSSETIVWPTDEEKHEIEAWFRDRHFPGVIGVIDGTHIKIDKPAEDPDSYLNRKQFFSIQIIPNMFHTASIWLTLALAVQRYIFVCHAPLARKFCTLPNVYKCLGYILFFAALHQGFRFFDTKYQTEYTAEVGPPTVETLG